MGYFAGDSNLLYFNCSIKNRLANLDMKHLPPSLNSNKMCLNIQKTELVIFKQNGKILEDEMKMQLNKKRLYSVSIIKSTCKN